MQNVIDVHRHFLPETYLQMAKQGEIKEIAIAVDADNGKGQDLEFVGLSRGQRAFINITPALSDGNLLIEDMQKHQISHSVVSLVPFTFHYTGPSGLVSDIHQTLNDQLSKLISGNKGKLCGLANVPLQDCSLAIRELERVMKKEGIVGVQLGSNVKDKELSDPEFNPFFEAAEALGAFVSVHPYNVAASDRLKNFYFRNLIGNPLDTTICAANLIFSGFLERFPGLRICLAHAGGYIPFAFGRLDHGAKVRKENESIPGLPSTYLRKFYYDTITHSSQALAYLVSVVGADRVLVGTDYPFDMGVEDPVAFINSGDLNEKDKVLILGSNALSLFKEDLCLK